MTEEQLDQGIQLRDRIYALKRNLAIFSDPGVIEISVIRKDGEDSIQLSNQDSRSNPGCSPQDCIWYIKEGIEKELKSCQEKFSNL